MYQNLAANDCTHAHLAALCPGSHRATAAAPAFSAGGVLLHVVLWSPPCSQHVSLSSMGVSVPGPDPRDVCVCPSLHPPMVSHQRLSSTLIVQMFPLFLSSTEGMLFISYHPPGIHCFLHTSGQWFPCMFYLYFFFLILLRRAETTSLISLPPHSLFIHCFFRGHLRWARCCAEAYHLRKTAPAWTSWTL